MPEDRLHVLARITSDPQIARVVPLLPPEVLHAVVTHYGLQDSGELPRDGDTGAAGRGLRPGSVEGRSRRRGRAIRRRTFL